MPAVAFLERGVVELSDDGVDIARDDGAIRAVVTGHRRDTRVVREYQRGLAVQTIHRSRVAHVPFDHVRAFSMVSSALRAQPMCQ